MPVSPTKIEHRSRGIVRTNLAITCDGAGAVAETIVGVGFGRLVGVFYNGGLDASAVITVKDKRTGATVLAYTTGVEGTPKSFRPTSVVRDNAGEPVVAALTATDVNRDIFIGGKISVTVASGGAAETAILALLVDETGVGDLANTV